MISRRRCVLQVELTGHTDGPHVTETMDDSRLWAQQLGGWSCGLTLTHTHSAGSHERMDVEHPFSEATWDLSKALRQYSGPCSLKSLLVQIGIIPELPHSIPGPESLVGCSEATRSVLPHNS